MGTAQRSWGEDRLRAGEAAGAAPCRAPRLSQRHPEQRRTGESRGPGTFTGQEAPWRAGLVHVGVYPRDIVGEGGSHTCSLAPL